MIKAVATPNPLTDNAKKSAKKLKKNRQPSSGSRTQEDEDEEEETCESSEERAVKCCSDPVSCLGGSALSTFHEINTMVTAVGPGLATAAGALGLSGKGMHGLCLAIQGLAAKQATVSLAAHQTCKGKISTCNSVCDDEIEQKCKEYCEARENCNKTIKGPCSTPSGAQYTTQRNICKEKAKSTFKQTVKPEQRLSDIKDFKATKVRCDKQKANATKLFQNIGQMTNTALAAEMCKQQAGIKKDQEACEKEPKEERCTWTGEDCDCKGPLKNQEQCEKVGCVWINGDCDCQRAESECKDKPNCHWDNKTGCNCPDLKKQKCAEQKCQWINDSCDCSKKECEEEQQKDLNCRWKDEKCVCKPKPQPKPTSAGPGARPSAQYGPLSLEQAPPLNTKHSEDEEEEEEEGSDGGMGGGGDSTNSGRKRRTGSQNINFPSALGGGSLSPRNTASGKSSGGGGGSGSMSDLSGGGFGPSRGGGGDRYYRGRPQKDSSPSFGRGGWGGYGGGGGDYDDDDDSADLGLSKEKLKELEKKTRGQKGRRCRRRRLPPKYF